METPPPLPTCLDRSGRQVRWLCVSGSGALLLVDALVPLSVIGHVHRCLFLRLTGYPCPFCGLTRAFIALAHGNVGGAWHIAPLGVPLFVTTVLIFCWSSTSLALRRPLCSTIPWRWVIPTSAMLVLMNWVYRLAAGLK